MTRIERLEPSRHKKDRFLVFLQGGELLKVTAAELLEFDLRPGRELEPDTLARLRQAAEHFRLRQQAAAMAGSRMLSKKELAERLVKKGAEPEEAAETACWLEELGAVDDAAYAGAIARHYAAMGYGAGRVRQELLRRGVSRELWEEALSQLPEPEEAIDRFLRTKLRGREPDPTTLRRLSDALLRRGFTWQEVKPCLGRLSQEIGEES